MKIDPKDYKIFWDSEGSEGFRYVTDRQVLKTHGREKFTIFQKYMEGQTCPIIECQGGVDFAVCYVWDYEKWVGHNCPDRDRSSSWD